MDEIRNLISRFENAVKRYDSASPTPRANGVPIWHTNASGIWRSLQTCNGASPPQAVTKTAVTDPRRARSSRKGRRWRAKLRRLKPVRRPKMKSP